MRRKKEPKLTREERFLGIQHPQEPEPTEKKFLSAQEAAAFLGIHRNTFTQWRVVGKGPVFVKRGGRVFYDTEVLQRWKNENVSIGGMGTKEAAEFLGVHHCTLSKWRQAGKGPAYVKIKGEVLYDLGVLEKYRKEKAC